MKGPGSLDAILIFTVLFSFHETILVTFFFLFFFFFFVFLGVFFGLWCVLGWGEN